MAGLPQTAQVLGASSSAPRLTGNEMNDALSEEEKRLRGKIEAEAQPRNDDWYRRPSSGVPENFDKGILVVPEDVTSRGRTYDPRILSKKRPPEAI